MDNIITSKLQEMAEKHKNFVQKFNGNTIQMDTMPEIAIQLFRDQFGINIYNKTDIPIVFSIGWTKILEFVGSQPHEEFAINVGGVSLEYVTERSETDKNSNIVPQMIHKTTPIFMKVASDVGVGHQYTNELLTKYNEWRSTNRCETIDKVERDVYDICRNHFGIDLQVSAAIIPLLSAIYTAGVQLARSTKQKISMYNIFEIKCTNDDKIILIPLSVVKQYLKSDSKK